MPSLQYVGASELARFRGLDAGAPQRAAVFADACRLNALSMIMEAGSGHIGTSFSCMDVLAWLHLEVLEDGDRYFSSKGHDAPGLYATLIGLGRMPFERIHTLRRLGGLPGHPDVGSTPEVVTNTGSLGMGISKARGFVLADRAQGRRGRVFVLTGDGELQEGQFWESLQPTANRGLGEITVIVDHNKIQSDTWVSEVSDLGDLEARVRSHGWEVARCDGHDLDAVAAALRTLSDAAPDRPKLLIADTVKGRGVSFMEPDDLPGAGDDSLSDAELTALQERFLADGWGDRRPVAVEQPFELVVGGRLIRGRIDAIYPRDDGGFDVIDFKTGQVPSDFAAASLQLSVYRLAWADLAGVGPAVVDAGFLYVRTGSVKRPDVLLSRDELAALLTG